MTQTCWKWWTNERLGIKVFTNYFPYEYGDRITALCWSSVRPNLQKAKDYPAMKCTVKFLSDPAPAEKEVDPYTYGFINIYLN